MATNLQQTVTFDDFSKGEWSTYGGIKPQPGTFTADNMIVRANGLIGPRAGLKDVTPASMPVGSLIALHAGPTPSKDGLFIVGNAVYYFDLFNAAVAPTAMGTLGATPSVVLKPHLATTKYYLAVPGDKCYVLDPIAGTTTALTGSPGGHAIVQYGVRLVVAESTGSNRIWVSDPQNFNSWPAPNFIDVGDDWQVTGFFVQKNHLAIFKREGLYVLTNTPTINEVIRLIDTMQGPLHPWQADIDQDDMIYMVSAFEINPATFDGNDGKQLAYLKELGGARDDTDATPPTKRGVQTFSGELTSSSTAVVGKDLAGDDIMLLNHNNVWTKHSIGVPVSGLMTASNSQLVISDGGAGGVAAKIYTTRTDLGRPAFLSDGLAALGDGSDTPLHATLTLPEWYSPDGTEVAVASVIIDVVKWSTGASLNNHIAVTSTSLGGYQRPGNTPAQTQDWDEAGSAALTTGLQDRLQFNFEQIRGAGFQIILNNIRGIDIRAVSVVVQMQPNLPRV